MAGPMALGKCPYCGETKPVTAAGVMRKHAHPVQLCPGSGRPPVESQCGTIVVRDDRPMFSCELVRGHRGECQGPPMAGPLMQRAGFKP